MTNGDLIDAKISDKKLNIAWRNCFIINQINFLGIKSYSSLSNVNKWYYLKFRIPIKHRQYFRIISENPENVKTF